MGFFGTPVRRVAWPNQEIMMRRSPRRVISCRVARSRALAIGADVYLQKPVQFADIISTVRTLLRVK